MLFSPHVNHVSVSPTNGIGLTQGQRKTVWPGWELNGHDLRVRSPLLYRLRYKVRREQFNSHPGESFRSVLVGLTLTWFTLRESSTSNYPPIIHSVKLALVTSFELNLKSWSELRGVCVHLFNIDVLSSHFVRWEYFPPLGDNENVIWQSARVRKHLVL